MGPIRVEGAPGILLILFKHLTLKPKPYTPNPTIPGDPSFAKCLPSSRGLL